MDLDHTGDPEEVIAPAVNGAKGLLGAISKGSKVKRVVLISSVAAVGSLRPDATYTEAGKSSHHPSGPRVILPSLGPG